MNACHSPLLTGTRAIRKAGRSTVCAGRSLSSDHGSVSPSTPRVNGPAGTSTSRPGPPGPQAAAHPGRAAARRRAAGGWPAWSRRAAARAARPSRRGTAAPESGSSSRSSPSKTRPRTSAMKLRDSRGDSRGRSIRLARGCSKASYSCSILHSSRPCAAALPPRSSQRSSCWPMWARSQTSGLISGLCWVVSSTSSTSVSCRVRARAASRPRAVCSRMRFLLEYDERAGLLDPARAARRWACARTRSARRSPRPRRAAPRAPGVPPARRRPSPPSAIIGSSSPRRAAVCQASATGAHSSAASSAATGSSTSVATRAATAGHQRSGSASTQRIST